ncbi:MAG: hypothetical protein WB696_23090 [Chthoniobacterales bacterium]
MKASVPAEDSAAVAAFRKIVADLFGLSNDLTKFSYRSGGHDKWRAKVHGIELSQIAPAKIQDWKRLFWQPPATTHLRKGAHFREHVPAPFP